MGNNSEITLNETVGEFVEEVEEDILSPEQELEDLKLMLGYLQSNIDVFFLFVMGAIIFFMQCGFAFLEAGAVRSKNTTNILLKNILDAFIGGLSYWLVGYALAFGEGNSFCGATFWASTNMEGTIFAHWFFHFVFAATSATIVSGSMAERCAFNAYLIYSIVLTAVVYPIVSHWAWASNGWLAQTDFQDFAGSGIVHMTGGVAALVGCVFLGPRLGRFGPNGREIRGHSVPLAALGGFILLFGFLAFNGGSQGSISKNGDAEGIAIAVVNTIISGCAGGITVLFLFRIGLFGKNRIWSFLVSLNGALTGMVAICAGCNVMRPWGAFVTGVVAGIIYLCIHTLLPKMRVDDPLDAIAVHLGGGFWGLIAVTLFQFDGIILNYSDRAVNILKWNMAGAGAITAWTGTICVIMFGVLRLIKLLRVDPEMEIRGLDILKHGEPAYPADAWEEDQYLSSSTEDLSLRNRRLPPNMAPALPYRGYPNGHPGAYPPAPHPPYYWGPYGYGSLPMVPSSTYPVYATLPNQRRRKHKHQNGGPTYASTGYVNDAYIPETESSKM